MGSGLRQIPEIGVFESFKRSNSGPGVVGEHAGDQIYELRLWLIFVENRFPRGRFNRG